MQVHTYMQQGDIYSPLVHILDTIIVTYFDTGGRDIYSYTHKKYSCCENM